MMPEFKTVGNVGDIAPGTGKAFEFGDQMVAIFLETDGTYLAIDDLCPDMGASLASGHFSEGIVTCPWHAWSFDARDGAWCDNRRLKIDTFQVRIQGDEIQLAVVESNDADGDSGSALGGASYGGRPNGSGIKPKDDSCPPKKDASQPSSNSASTDDDSNVNSQPPESGTNQ